VSGSTVVHLPDLPASEDVAGGEVFEAEAVEEGDVSRVDLDDGAGTVCQILLGLANAVRSLELARSRLGIPGRVPRRAHVAPELLEDPLDHRS
jgi:hypothetical protein